MKRPSSNFLKLPCDFWHQEYDEQLSLAAISMLLVLLGEKQPCELPTERVRQWYGWSADTAEKGLHELISDNLVSNHPIYKETPLSPTGFTKVNSYTLLTPFARPTDQRVTSLRSGRNGGE